MDGNARILHRYRSCQTGVLETTPDTLNSDNQRRMSKTEHIARFAEVSRLGSLVRQLGGWSGILIFGYHRVGLVDDSGDPSLWDATPPVFEQQLRLLKKEFDVIGPDELETVVRAGRGRYVLLTFDDGYRDNFDEALPILKRHGLPATFFVTTGFLDGRQISWWDEIAWMVHASTTSELRANGCLDSALSFAPQERRRTILSLIGRYKRLPRESMHAFLDALAEATGSGRHHGDHNEVWMTWDNVRELRASGMRIGGHTVNHPLLARLSVDEQEQEIIGCKSRIETELGEPMRYFAYPYGERDSFDDNTRRCLAEHGVELAFSLYNGYQRFKEWDPYDVRRRGLGPNVNPRRFALMLTLPQVFAGG
jgi:peptidoglycan/xylan/chitin deacetylase (PgdA/CDA1 family)